jgi:hypothetical protein
MKRADYDDLQRRLGNAREQVHACAAELLHAGDIRNGGHLFAVERFIYEQTNAVLLSLIGTVEGEPESEGAETETAAPRHRHNFRAGNQCTCGEWKRGTQPKPAELVK